MLYLSSLVIPVYESQMSHCVRQHIYYYNWLVMPFDYSSLDVPSVQERIHIYMYKYHMNEYHIITLLYYYICNDLCVEGKRTKKSGKIKMYYVGYVHQSHESGIRECTQIVECLCGLNDMCICIVSHAAKHILYTCIEE